MKRGKRNLALILGSAVIALLVTIVISWQVYAGASDLAEFLAAMSEQPDYLNLILVNGLVGVSVALFVVELRWQALRVLGTVAFALLLGYFVTFFFNLLNHRQQAFSDFRSSRNRFAIWVSKQFASTHVVCLLCQCKQLLLTLNICCCLS